GGRRGTPGEAQAVSPTEEPQFPGKTENTDPHHAQQKQGGGGGRRPPRFPLPRRSPKTPPPAVIPHQPLLDCAPRTRSSMSSTARLASASFCASRPRSTTFVLGPCC